jgi:hypothetical protein
MSTRSNGESTAQRYPLSWPTGWRRTPVGTRQHGRFGIKRAGDYRRPITVEVARVRVLTELSRLGVAHGDALLSTNLRVRLDGSPYSDAKPEGGDPGVAVYFRLDGKDRVLACDRWTTVADNLAAVAAHIEAIRAVDRYGVGTLDQAFAGYVGLPAKGTTWKTTLGFAVDAAPTTDEIQAAFRQRARTAHPDVADGSHDAMASLVAARDEGLSAV